MISTERRLTAYVSPEEKVEFAKLAEEQGRSVSGQIAWMVKQSVKKQSGKWVFVPPALLAEVNGIIAGYEARQGAASEYKGDTPL